VKGGVLGRGRGCKSIFYMKSEGGKIKCQGEPSAKKGNKKKEGERGDIKLTAEKGCALIPAQPIKLEGTVGFRKDEVGKF